MQIELTPEQQEFIRRAIDCRRVRSTEEAVREALAVTHELLLGRPGSAIFVAEAEGGERVGLLWFGENRNLITGENEAWVYNVSVLPSQRGRGIGAMLMERAETYAREAGYASLGLMVASHEVTSIVP